jgi:hypothetical protein
MSLIEHWWLVLRPDGAAYAVRSTLELAEHYARNMGLDWSVVEVEPSANHQGAVDDGLRELVADAREQCQRNGIGDDKLPAWIGKMVLARVTGEGQ